MSELKVTGTVVSLPNIQTGVSKSGKEWQKQDVVIETQEQFSKSICFTAFGEKVDLLKGLLRGDTIEVSFNAESKEFNGKWFTNLNVWKIVKVSQGQNTNAQPRTSNPPNPIDNIPEDPTDDLPF